MEKQMKPIHHDIRDEEELALLDEHCLDIRIPAHLVGEPDEEERS